MKLFKSKSKRENILNLIREFLNSEEYSLNHGTDKLESDIESLKVRVHRLECEQEHLKKAIEEYLKTIRENENKSNYDSPNGRI